MVLHFFGILLRQSTLVGDHLSFTVATVVVLFTCIICVWYCFKIFTEGDTSCVSHALATRLQTRPGVWFRCRWCFVSRCDRFAGPCSSWSGWVKAFERPSFRSMENVISCNVISVGVINLGPQYFSMQPAETSFRWTLTGGRWPDCSRIQCLQGALDDKDFSSKAS